MLSSAAAIFILCITGSASARIPASRAVEHDGSGTITLTPVDNEIGFLAATLQVTCNRDGSVDLFLSSAETDGTAVVSIDGGLSGAVPPVCEATFPFSLPPGSPVPPPLSVSAATAAACEVTAVNGVFVWPVEVVQKFPRLGSLDDFVISHSLKVTCAVQTIVSPIPIQPENPVTDAPVAISVNTAIPFRIVKGPTVGNRWNFVLSPVDPAQLVGSNYRIVSCTATAPSLLPGGPVLTADLISQSCVRDRGTTVTTVPGTPPAAGTRNIAVSIFRFSANPAAQVTLTCDVELCTTGVGSCPEVTPFGTTCPVPPPRGAQQSRSRRSIAPQVYKATVKW